MKKLLAVATVLAISLASLSAFAACGSNAGRNTNTTGGAPNSGTTHSAPGGSNVGVTR